MSFWTIFAFIGNLFGIAAADSAVIQAGGIANTPVANIGTTGGKPLYLRGQLSTDKTFGGTATEAPTTAQEAAARFAACRPLTLD